MTTKKHRVLIIEDEAPIRQMLRFSMPAGYDLIEAENTLQGRIAIAKRQPDIILLDWMLPGKSGVEFAKELRGDVLTRNIPIILLTARAEEENKIKGLESGADDYVTKPFSPRELFARIKSILKRGPIAYPDNVLIIHTITLNLTKHEVKIGDNLLSLSPINYRLLHFLIKNPDHIYTRDQLLNQVWDDALDKTDRAVDVQIKRLRGILGPYGYADLIKTVRGIGYQLVST
jgi:two-component system phosphate regulon response regulator PhoB